MTIAITMKSLLLIKADVLYSAEDMEMEIESVDVCTDNITQKANI